MGGTVISADNTGGSLGGIADFNGARTALGFGYLNKAGSLLLNARLTAVEETGESRTISAPRIMAANDQTVSIKQGAQFPYQSAAGGSSGGTTTEFKEAALELKVTPHIEENGQVITLDIDIKDDGPIGSGSEPAISTNQAKTKLMVRDGDTVVIGGIMKDDQRTGSTRVPGLHRLPLLGWLFEENTSSNIKTELLIFITANIIPISI
jgi:type IV pilus assembly protein PilQ